jgi:peroxiredoxin
MLDVGTRAPDFTLPMVTADGVESFTLSEHLECAPIVLVSFPAAFTGTCRTELGTFRDRQQQFGEAGATLLGLSVDTPLVLSAFQEAEGFGFPLLSDADRAVVRNYGLTEDFPEKLASDLAARAILVIDGDQAVRWTWRGDPGEEPDYAAVLEAVSASRKPEGLCASEGEERP